VWVGVCSDTEREDLIAQANLPLVVKESESFHVKEGLFWNRAEWKMS
jgi:hypothetical protein